MHVVVYSSRYTGDAGSLERDLGTIVSSSKRNNPPLGVTGVMFHQRGLFLQFLEGEQEVLGDLMAKIESDARHSNIEYLFNDPVDERGLSDWNMDCFDLDQSEEVTEQFLNEISEGYRGAFAVDTNVLVSLFKSFIDDKAA